MLTGTFSCGALRQDPFMVLRGRCQFFSKDPQTPGTKNVSYDFDRVGTNGEMFHFNVYNVIDDSIAFALWPNLDRLKHIPIFFFSGGDNNVYTPEATDMSYTILRDGFDEGQYKRDVFEEFGHLDCWMGEKASDVIRPRIREHMVKVCGGLINRRCPELN
jgi:hypothetical protein